MPLISHTNPEVADILEHQIKWGLDDTAMGLALLGPDAKRPGQVVRAWKAGESPSGAVGQAFRYLKALAAITDNSPLSDAEENYNLAFCALPKEMQ
jgi:hypothetical protein